MSEYDDYLLKLQNPLVLTDSDNSYSLSGSSEPDPENTRSRSNSVSSEEPVSSESQIVSRVQYTVKRSCLKCSSRTDIYGRCTECGFQGPSPSILIVTHVKTTISTRESFYCANKCGNIKSLNNEFCKRCNEANS